MTDAETMLIDYMKRILCQKDFYRDRASKVCSNDGRCSRISLSEKCAVGNASEI